MVPDGFIHGLGYGVLCGHIGCLKLLVNSGWQWVSVKAGHGCNFPCFQHGLVIFCDKLIIGHHGENIGNIGVHGCLQTKNLNMVFLCIAYTSESLVNEFESYLVLVCIGLLIVINNISLYHIIFCSKKMYAHRRRFLLKKLSSEF